MTNLEWIAAGNKGCTFATLFARNPEKVGYSPTVKEAAKTTWLKKDVL